MIASRRTLAGVCVSLLLLTSLVAFTAEAEWYHITLRSTSKVVVEDVWCNQSPNTTQQDIANEASNHQPLLTSATIVRKHIAIASVFSFHFDVYMAFAWTLERILAGVPTSELRVFSQPFYYGFQSVVDDLGLYHGPQHDIEDFLPYVRNNPTLDMIVLGTCEVDLRQLHSELLSEWDSRPDNHKFRLVCIVHNVADTAWQAHIGDWSRRGAIRLLPLGEHIKGAFRNKFDALADSADPHLHTAGYEHIAIDVHIPVLDVPGLPEKEELRKLSRAVIQGSFDTSRRDYRGLFDELIRSLHEDPRAWGYHSLGDRTSFVPDYRSAEPPFELALVGSGSLEVPEELAYMVSIYRGLDYFDFYKLVASMDIVVPAFAENGYYEHQASSTVALAVELDVPILATRRMRRAYKYIDDDRAVVTRPAAMREVEALKALRTGNASWFLEREPVDDGIPLSSVRNLVDGVRRMLEGGWVRPKTDVRQYKEALWNQNELVASRLLRDE